MFKYLRSVNEEMKKVTWLTADETQRDTSYVVLSALFFSAFLGGIGWVFRGFILWLMSH
ncbi:MAG: preprotein translocase subunit SecE [Lactobacillaceae bacterium]|jgi:preprotein translocase SecE subunit|nr:preprotein translocase subunit SecE [Lactobacillaceae bacterium]